MVIKKGRSYRSLPFVVVVYLLFELVGDGFGTFLDGFVTGLFGGGGSLLLDAVVVLLFHSGLELLVALVGSVGLAQDALDAALNAGGVGLVAVAFGTAGLSGGVQHGLVVSIAHLVGGGDLLNGVHNGGVLSEGVGSGFLVVLAGDCHGGDEESAANKR